MDLRQIAEERATKMSMQQEGGYGSTASSGISPMKPDDRRRSKRFLPSPAGDVNMTPEIARLNEIDYKWNGSRARVSMGEFIPPRWIPDEAATQCVLCKSEFDWINRRHHCRHCGNIYCGACTEHTALLPDEFGLRDPQRVCKPCSDVLRPLQSSLQHNIANHQQLNSVNIASTNCNMRRYCNMPVSFNMASQIRKAAYTVYNFQQTGLIKDRAIPLRLLANAKGLAFITIIKGGFFFAPRIGTGIVIARMRSGQWSAPTAIGTFGVAWGLVAGLELTDYMVLLNTDDAVRVFAGSGQLCAGGVVDLTIGPIGRTLGADIHIGDNGLAATYSYSHSRGLMAGLTVEASVVFARQQLNHNFYGRSASPQDILSGRVPPPRAAEPLYAALTDAESAAPDIVYLRRDKVQRLLSQPVSVHPTKRQSNPIRQDIENAPLLRSPTYEQAMQLHSRSSASANTTPYELSDAPALYLAGAAPSTSRSNSARITSSNYVHDNAWQDHVDTSNSNNINSYHFAAEEEDSLIREQY